jgi:tRNA threonylcarbamoyladenosine biosynthesis protein TsaE
MEYLGALFASALEGNELILMTGPLGAGKSTFTKGIGAVLSIQETILSPTFVLVREYGNPLSLIHVDLYRVETPEELQDLGIQDILNRDVIRVIEWADKFPALDKWAHYQIRFSLVSESIRKVKIDG